MDLERQLLISDIENDIYRIKNVLTTNIFAQENFKHPLQRAAFTELVLCLNDLLQKAKDLKVPVMFTDDIPSDIKRKDGKPLNITDFVSMVRNAVCHITSGTHFLIKTENQQFKATYNILYGKTNSPLVSFNGQSFLQGLYEDDFCFNFGKLNLYYNRHIIRSFLEAQENLLPFISSNTHA